MTSAEAWFSNSLRPRKPEGSLGRTAQDGHLDSHTAPELWRGRLEGGRLYTYRFTVTTRMTPALRWAVMRAILMFHQLWGTKSQDSVHKPQLLKRKESLSRIEPRSFRLPAYRLTTRPNRLSVGQLLPKRVKYPHRHPFLFLFLPHPHENSLCSQPIRGKVRLTGRIFPRRRSSSNNPN